MRFNLYLVNVSFQFLFRVDSGKCLKPLAQRSLIIHSNQTVADKSVQPARDLVVTKRKQNRQSANLYTALTGDCLKRNALKGYA